MITKKIESKRFWRAIAGVFFLAFVSSLIVISSATSATDSETAASNKTIENQETDQGGSTQSFNTSYSNGGVFSAHSVDDSNTVGKWRRYVVSLPNNIPSENPFELEVDGTFTHTASGSTITLPGYYAGNNTWKIGFMPTKTGEWTYVTSSPDSDLNGVIGSVICVESCHPGVLKADPTYPRKWKFTDGSYVVPIALRMEFFSEPGSKGNFTAVADFLKNNSLLLETRLTEERGQFENGRHDFIFEGDWRNHQFDLRIWDRMEGRMEILTERGLGAHIMFYSDDAGKPGWIAKSETEKLVIRYVVARLAGYPVVLFNTGIDIAEYRDQSWVNWFGQQIRSLDPYGHPVSSRYGGGSGSLVMSEQTFDSRGNRLAKIDDMRSYFLGATVPVSMDDAWGENRPSHTSKNFRPEDIRRAFWKCVVVGGLGGLIRGSDGYFHIADVQSDLESESWLSLVNPFIQEKLGDIFSVMIPDQSLVSNGHCLADPARTRILYFLMGKNDKWDSGNGGAVTVKLSGLAGSYTAKWFDPRIGTETELGSLVAGTDHVLTPPSTDDWVLLLTMEPVTTPVITPTPNEVGWNNITQVVVTFFRADYGTGISHTNYSKTSETGPWTTVGTCAATGPDAVNVTDIHEANFNVTVLKEGLTEIWYYSVDNTSNIEHTKNVTVKIDVTSPIITIHSPENKTYHTKIIHRNFTANEPLDTCRLSVDSTPNQTNCKNQSVISREYEAREGTVAWWHFNGDANDTSGTNNHGIINGTSFVAGKFGSALFSAILMQVVNGLILMK